MSSLKTIVMKKRRKKTEKELPGYPHYPDSEDVMKTEERVDTDVENLSRSKVVAHSKLKKQPPGKRVKSATPEILKGTEADLSKQDLISLGPVDRDQDEGDDELFLPG